MVNKFIPLFFRFLAVEKKFFSIPPLFTEGRNIIKFLILINLLLLKEIFLCYGTSLISIYILNILII